MKNSDDRSNYFSIIESLLFVSGESLDIKQIASIIKCDVKFTKNLLDDMMITYKKDCRGIEIMKDNDRYSFVTKSKNSSYVEKLLGKNSRQSLSQASLETLAIIAYKQPITRIDIDEIRGVKSDRAISTLIEKRLIRENGKLNVPGKPILYGTTEEFLKHFGIQDLGNIPDLNSLIV
ncbi:SMC-Scp complex subunit ScpB [Clostridium luticellarii]|jgi:segregation and condensation protein B|uniref:Segregation and condensation protein B n=1 Tax=Clostridium luticellarii TaxID=1691940 RepID=A0A2T0BRL7_9CLOT|nr:SMC-Scp complex subunit ScpB [Clostridium luticellarii]MCI1943770.1 segregation/condensation protein B [Clostridium luticellarii]MCI1967031.1 segregation/condensation protein B [Clostridium luticellarii]MCI1994398.1 segregation/condensation protein B [Clostridium luticellarii]MCI2038649.1 segregation/condensation protein B [Clostridium luticellarii]PRR86523.1 Segregation and condensation protein B [Clostridium luticellarii]